MNYLGIALTGKVIKTRNEGKLVRVFGGFGANPSTAGRALYCKDADGKADDYRYAAYDLATDEEVEAFEQEERHAPVRKVKVLEDRITKLQGEVANLQVELVETRRQAADILARDFAQTSTGAA